MRRLPGPPGCRLGEGENSGGLLRIVSGLAENTNSIICDGSSEPETANGCPVLQRQEPPTERHTIALPGILIRLVARSPERARRPRVFLLTLTYMEVGIPDKSFRCQLTFGGDSIVQGFRCPHH